MQLSRWMLLLAGLASSACAHGAAPPRRAPAVSESSLARPRARFDQAAWSFFDRYVGFIEAPDPAVVDLYDDRAHVHTLHHFADGHTAPQAMTGAQYKRAIRTMYTRIKMVGDPDARAAFSDLSLSTHPRGFRLAARRYAKIKCTHDASFYMVLAPDERGSLRIVEEGSETWAESQCGLGADKPLAQRMDEMIAQLAPLLPRMVDGETRLDAMTREGDMLRYAYTLVRVAAADFDAPAFQQTMLDLLRRQACATSNKRALLEANGRLGYVYVDRQGGTVASIDFGLEACAAPKGNLEPDEGPVASAR